jgi:chaperonin cofactor prefoldin
MAIHRLLQGRAFDPEAVRVMVKAFEDTLRELNLSSRDDAIAQTVARAIIECAERDVLDPIEMRKCALEAIRGISQ